MSEPQVKRLRLFEGYIANGELTVIPAHSPHRVAALAIAKVPEGLMPFCMVEAPGMVEAFEAIREAARNRQAQGGDDD